MKFILILALLCVACPFSQAAADLAVIVHPAQETQIDEKDLLNYYLGITKTRYDLLDQTAGPARVEFYEKFLKKTETQVKQLWAISVFSGYRAPKVLSDDRAVYEYVKRNPMAVGFVSKSFLTSEKTGSEEPKVILTVQ